jgi:hypothetical protein
MKTFSTSVINRAEQNGFISILNNFMKLQLVAVCRERGAHLSLTLILKAISARIQVPMKSAVYIYIMVSESETYS